MRRSRIAAAAWRRISSNFLNFYIEPRASAQAFWHGRGVIFPLRPDPRPMPGGLQWSVNVSRSNFAAVAVGRADIGVCGDLHRRAARRVPDPCLAAATRRARACLVGYRLSGWRLVDGVLERAFG